MSATGHVNHLRFRLRAFEVDWVEPLEHELTQTTVVSGSEMLVRTLLEEANQWKRLGAAVGHFPESSAVQRKTEHPELDWLLGVIRERDSAPIELDAVAFARELTRSQDDLTSERRAFLRLICFADEHEWNTSLNDLEALRTLLTRNQEPSPSLVERVDWSLQDFAWDEATTVTPSALPADWRMSSFTIAVARSPIAARRFGEFTAARAVIAEMMSPILSREHQPFRARNTTHSRQITADERAVRGSEASDPRTTQGRARETSRVTSASHPAADLVLAGGGVNGIGHVGVMSVLEEHGYELRRVAATSAGAIVGALAAAGMSTPQLRDAMSSTDFGCFQDATLLGRIPFVGAGLSLLLEDGIFNGDALRAWVEEQLARMGVRTFADLKFKDAGSSLPPEQSYKLVVMATDVTRGELVRLPWDYKRYGLDPDKQLVCDAVRASISIPFFFRPVSLFYKGVPSTLVDGGVLSNFPIDAFDRTDGAPPRWPTFGVTLIPELPAGNKDLFPVLGLIKQGPLKLAERLLTTMLVGRDQTHLAKPWIAARAMQVMTNDVGVVDFGISPAQQMELFENGRTAARSFMRTWDWDTYRERFGAPARTSSLSPA